MVKGDHVYLLSEPTARGYIIEVSRDKALVEWTGASQAWIPLVLLGLV